MNLADLDDSSEKNLKSQATEISSETHTFFNGNDEGHLTEKDLEEMVI